MNNLVILVCMCLGIFNSITAQTQLQYELIQQGSSACPGSTITLSVSTSVNITTAVVSEITNNAVTTGGNITNDGGSPVTQRGVCWSTSPNPTINANITNNGNDLGSYISNLSGLTANTTYYLRAFAINGTGTFYGDEVTFTTQIMSSSTFHSCGAENVHNLNLNYGNMIDQDGYMYKTIVVGNQMWMAENLKVSHYRNGDLIPNITENTQWAGLTSGAWTNYNNDSVSYVCPYGKLYNWYTVSDLRNLCPEGWHVPSDNEWTTLTNYLTGGNVAGKLKSSGTQFWWSPNSAATNESGFSGLPGGFRNSSPINGLIFNGIGGTGVWWSSTESGATSAKYRALAYNGSINVGNSSSYKTGGNSVRCLKD